MSELKYVIFFLATFIGVPVGILFAYRFPVVLKGVVVLLIFTTVIPDDTSINFYSREFYFALTKGIEISLGDLCALVILGVIFLRRDEYRAPGIPPMSFFFIVVIASGILSWIFAPASIVVPEAAQMHPFFLPYDIFETRLYPLFETSKWIRGFLLFLALYYYLRKVKNLDTVVLGVALAAVYLGYVVLTDRYIHGIHRVKATFQHPNSLATYMAMSGTFMFAILLAEKRFFRVGLLCAGLGLAGLSVIMTISRGGLGALIIGLGLAFLLLGWRNISIKNGFLLFLGGFAGVLVLAAAADTLLNRFVGEQDAAGDLEYRMYYNNQAKLMASEHLFGVGMGNFSAFSWDQYAARVDPDNPPGTPAHNIWFLTLGETGYPGLIAFVLFWLRFFTMSAPLIIWRLRGMPLSAVTGSALLCLVCHVQSMVQLSFRQTPIFFLMMIAIAIVAALKQNQSRRDKSESEPIVP